MKLLWRGVLASNFVKSYQSDRLSGLDYPGKSQMRVFRSYFVHGLFGLAAVLGIAGCIDGPRMLTQSERVPLVEKGKWCKFDGVKRDLLEECYTFVWHNGYYQADDRRYGFKQIGEGKFIGETVELDEKTGEPKFKFWPKFVMQTEGPNKKMVNLGHQEDHFEDFERVAQYYSDARGATLNVEIDPDFGSATWYVQGSPYAIRRVLSDLVDHLDPDNNRYYNIVADAADPDSELKQIANIARGTDQQTYVASSLCAAGVARGKDPERTPEDIQFIKRAFAACEMLQALGLAEQFALAILAWDEGRTDDADAYFRKAIAQPYENDERELRDHVLYKWAESYYMSENYEQVVRIFSQLLDENPQHLSARSVRGLAYRLLGDTAKAMTDYNETIDLAAAQNNTLELAIAHMRRGYVHQAEGRLEKAMQDMNVALELQPDLSYAHSSLGIIAEKKGDSAAARQHFHDALELDPYNSHATEGMARIN